MRQLILGLVPTMLFLVGCWSGPTQGVPTSNEGGTVVEANVNDGPPQVIPEQPSGFDPTLTKPSQVQENGRYVFPDYIPGSHIVIGKELVDEVNALATKEEQIRFLIAILPPVDQQEKRLSERQLHAIRLLSLTDSEDAINPLMNHLDFGHMRDGSPCVHALARLGNRSVGPVIKNLQDVAASERTMVNAYVAILILIKGKQFPMFVDELKRGDDVKLSDEIIQSMLNQFELFQANELESSVQ